MEALAKNLIDDAKALMHPKTTSEDMNARFEQMIDFLDGREVVSKELEGINVSSSVGTSGNTKQEDLFYKATLSDNSVVYINAVYLADDDGAGFKHRLADDHHTDQHDGQVGRPTGVDLGVTNI